MLSFRKRLALVHFVAIVVVLAVGAGAAYWSLSRAVHGQLDAALLALAEQELGMLAAGSEAVVRVHEVPAGPLPPSFQRLDRLVQIIDAEGRVLARSANLGEAQLPVPPVLLARLARGETVFETLLGYGEEPTRMVAVPLQNTSARATAASLRAVQVAGSLDDVDRVVQSASVLFLVLGLALVVVVGAAGALLTRRVFGAIDDVVQQAHRIGDGNLGTRLPHPGTRDEIGRLVDTLNEMLGRIEHSFEAQRRFTADASHELRSPLSRLRTELEVTLRRPRDAADYMEALRSCVDEVERLTLLVDELLALARLDAGQDAGGLEETTAGSGNAQAVCMNDVAEQAVRRIEASAGSRGIGVSIEPADKVHAVIGPGPASVMLANLLDNAIKFSQPGGTVTVGIDVAGDMARVQVADTGPGIAPGELPHLFERFYRGAATRAEPMPGTGLGLALSQAIANAHGGRIDAANQTSGGAVFTLRLPLRQKTPSPSGGGLG